MTEYRKNLGLIELVSFGVGGTIGSGIFVVPGIVAGIAGPSSLISWLIVALSASCVTLSLAYASSKYPSTGAFYSIFQSVFSRRLSTALVLLYLIASVFGAATIAAGIGQYVTFLGYGNVLWLEVVVIALFGTVNIIGVKPSGNLENVLTLLKTLPLLILAVVLLPHVRLENFTPFFGGEKIDFLRSVIIVYWCFTGFEITAIPAEETKNKADVFRSLVIVMLIVATVYLLLNLALIGSVGSQLLASSPAPVATAAAKVLKRSGNVVAVIGIIAMMSALNAYLLAASRVLQNLSLEVRLPLISKLGARGTPYVAILVSAVSAASLLFFSNRFRDLATGSVLATLLPYLFVCVAVLKLFESRKIRAVAAIGVVSTLGIMLTALL